MCESYMHTAATALDDKKPAGLFSNEMIGWSGETDAICSCQSQRCLEPSDFGRRSVWLDWTVLSGVQANTIRGLQLLPTHTWSRHRSSLSD
jgi:hypothetical protein